MLMCETFLKDISVPSNNEESLNLHTYKPYTFLFVYIYTYFFLLIEISVDKKEICQTSVEGANAQSNMHAVLTKKDCEIR